MRLQVEVEPKSLGITIDSHLRFDCHTKEVARECNYHALALHHVCTLLTNDLAQTVACSIITSRLDYCNAMLRLAPAATFEVLQRTQNNLAHSVWLPQFPRVRTNNLEQTTTGSAKHRH